MWGSFRVSQVLAAVSFLAAATVLVIKHFRPGDSQLFVDQVNQEKAE